MTIYDELLYSISLPDMRLYFAGASVWLILQLTSNNEIEHNWFNLISKEVKLERPYAMFGKS